MDVSWHWWYGFIGFLGFIGFITGNYAFCNTFMFFLIFIHKGNRPDERWERSVSRACEIALFFMLAILCLTLTLIGSMNQFPIGILPILSATLLLAGVSVFVLSYAYFDRRGD